MRISRTLGSSAIAVLLAAPLLHSQVEPPKPPDYIPPTRVAVPPTTVQDGWHRPFPGLVPQPKKPEPGPRHDIGGLWDPGPTSGIQVQGAAARPDDGNPAHEPPYTPLGRPMLDQTKPSAPFRS